VNLVGLLFSNTFLKNLLGKTKKNQAKNDFLQKTIFDQIGFVIWSFFKKK